ncbi:unnamed protein product [Pleuronectes platessa]|uniref:Uncharacterized protein n=1 Tax=Pleuronectes platessa TaxID=8262 RepID=A0A9N7TG53_PLEPL|nr:unnamed protein product [Pleuronectes platessa]
MSAVQLLRVSVHERISAAAEDFLLQVERGGGKAQVPELRAMLTERLAAAGEQILAGLEEILLEYEDRVERTERSEREISRQRRLLDAAMQPVVRLHRAVCPADIQQLIVIKEEVPPEEQQWSPLVDQEDPEPPHIKEEQEEPWTNQDGQQLQGLEEADIKFTLTPVAVKSEEDEEKLKSSKLHPSETKENRPDCGGPEPARNSGPDGRLQPATEDKTEDSSETEVSEDEWMEIREPQTGLNTRNTKQPLSDMGWLWNKKSSGRPKTISPALSRRIRMAVRQDTGRSSSQIKAITGADCNPVTIRRHLRRKGFKNKKRLQRPRLLQRHKMPV